jgi:hypothetical protein
MTTSVPARPNHRVLCDPRLYVRRVVFIPISDFLREIAPLRVVEYTRNCLLQQERRAFLFLLKSCARQKMLGALHFKSCELLASTLKFNSKSLFCDFGVPNQS